MSRRRSAGSAAAVAELQATTSSLIRRAMSSSATSRAKASSSAAERSPYGKRAASARYTKSSWGSWTSSSCRTVSPPTPESNTPTGRRRSSSGASAMAGDGIARQSRTAPRGSARRARAPRDDARAQSLRLGDAVDRALDLLDDRLGDARVLERPARGDDPGDQHGDEQDQADVLDRPLTVLRPDQPGMRPPLQLVDGHHGTPWLGVLVTTGSSGRGL